VGRDVVVVLVLLVVVFVGTVVVVDPVEPPVTVAVPMVSAPALVHAMGRWAVPRAMVRVNGLAVVN
jgi:hypothetical protein